MHTASSLNNQQSITVSIGLGILQPSMNLQDLIKTADAAQYRAKNRPDATGCHAAGAQGRAYRMIRCSFSLNNFGA